MSLQGIYVTLRSREHNLILVEIAVLCVEDERVVIAVDVERDTVLRNQRAQQEVLHAEAIAREEENLHRKVEVSEVRSIATSYINTDLIRFFGLIETRGNDHVAEPAQRLALDQLLVGAVAKDTPFV